MFLDNVPAEVNEAELRMFWQVGELNRRLIRSDPESPEIDELRDELDVLARMTNWPRLRDACLRAINLCDAARRQRKIGAA